MKTGVYTAEEDAAVIAAVMNRRTSEQIAVMLDRSASSVERRREKLRKQGRLEKVVQGTKPKLALFQQEQSTPTIRMVLSPWFKIAGGVLMRTVRAA